MDFESNAARCGPLRKYREASTAMMISGRVHVPRGCNNVGWWHENRERHATRLEECTTVTMVARGPGL